MTGATHNGNDFISRLTEIVEANFRNEQFGVNELAREMGMSRSFIHRHLKKLTSQSISHFIRNVRLDKAMEILRETNDSASEVAFKVGFSSPSYFNHCFHERFGFPPGEAKKRLLLENGVEPIQSDEQKTESGKKSNLKKVAVITLFTFFTFLIIWLVFNLLNPEKSPGSFFQHSKKEASIIVLPFKNFSDNQANQYFADGIMEDILNNLFHVTALRVVSRTSAEQFRESTLSTKEIAAKSHVNFILEGSVRKYGEETRISVQLIDAKKDQHIWSANFDRKMTDVMGVQGEIAKQVAENLNTVLSAKEVSQIEKISTQNATAYDNYLRARFLLHKANSAQRADFEKSGVLNCLQYYEKAIAADSTFAEAYAGLANAWLNLSAWGFLPAYEGFPKAKIYATKALKYDPDCAEAHAVTGAHFIWGGGRNIAEGSKELKKAVELNPNFSTAHQWYAQSLMITGPIEEARLHVNRALELEPYFWVVQTLSAWIYYFEKKHEKAIEECKVARALNPDFTDNDWLFVLNYAKLGEGEKMLQELQTIIKKYTRDEKYLEEIQMAFNEKGINGIFAWLIEVNNKKPIKVEGMDGHPFYSAWWNAILGNKNEAVYWLEQTLEYPRPLGHYSNLITTNPDFDLLRDDPRFLEIVDKFGLTPWHKIKVE
ncbi:MAG: helix-turn-helix domain-containing protein [Mariniphaga sp.]|nr:helix-turn-helix domain-containing protein [Mariniphaga sp.]